MSHERVPTILEFLDILERPQPTAPDQWQCVICQEGDANSQNRQPVRVCANNHMMHKVCVVLLIKNRSPHSALCPLCKKEICLWGAIVPEDSVQWRAYLWNVDFDTVMDPSGIINNLWAPPASLPPPPTHPTTADNLLVLGAGVPNPTFPMGTPNNASGSRADNHYSNIDPAIRDATGRPRNTGAAQDNNADPRPMANGESFPRRAQRTPSHRMPPRRRVREPFSLLSSDEEEVLAPWSGPSRAASRRRSSGQPYPSNAARIARNRRRAGLGSVRREGTAFSPFSRFGQRGPSRASEYDASSDFEQLFLHPNRESYLDPSRYMSDRATTNTVVMFGNQFNNGSFASTGPSAVNSRVTQQPISQPQRLVEQPASIIMFDNHFDNGSFVSTGSLLHSINAQQPRGFEQEFPTQPSESSRTEADSFQQRYWQEAQAARDARQARAAPVPAPAPEPLQQASPQVSSRASQHARAGSAEEDEDGAQ